MLAPFFMKSTLSPLGLVNQMTAGWFVLASVGWLVQLKIG